MSEAILELRGVKKSYKSKTVLDGVNLAVFPGSVLGLLGKNGSGKTTLLKCALGLVKPQEGSIFILNEDAWSLSAAAKAKLGYVPQEISLYPWMKVGQVIAYTAAFYPHWNETLVDRLVKEWELNPKDRVGPLSVGQLQKLAIILALGHEPELLILDEPVASLDPIARRDFLRTLLDIAGEGGRTVIFSTQITSDLERVADHVAILRSGKIVYHDELDTLKDSVKRLRISAASPLPRSDFSVPGMIHCDLDGHEALVSVAGFSPKVQDEIERQWSASVAVEDLNLEEIFLEMHHG